MLLLLCLSWPKFNREDNNFGIDSIYTPRKRTLYSSTTFETIRIKLDFQYFDGTVSDPLKCTTVGEYKTWNGGTFQCAASDIPNSTKIEAFKGTMTNIKNYLERFLKVLPSTEPISLQSDPTREKSIVRGTNITDADLYLVFFLRPFSNAERSSSTVSFSEKTYNRNIQTNLYMNQGNLPDIVQGENTPISGDFYRILRDVMNAVALSDNYIAKFHPKYDPTIYDSIICNLTKYGKTFSVLTTPYAHYYAMKNYGNETFYGDDKTCPSGIIIEDSGLSPGDGAESTIYYTDISNSESTQGDFGKFRRVTDVTMAFFLDSGNYEVNWSMAQPLIWGNKDSIDGNYIKGWPLTPPETALPDNYFYDPNTPLNNVGYDFNTWGTPATQVVNCTDPTNLADIHYCRDPAYYNPKGYSVAGVYESLDDQLVKYPYRMCPSGKATIQGLTYYGDDTCASYTCNGYTSFTLDIITDETTNATTSFTCSSKGQTYSFTRYITSSTYTQKTITCPSPEQFCRTREMLDQYFTSDPFSGVIFPTPKPTPAATPPPTPKPTPEATPAFDSIPEFEPIRITNDNRFFNGTYPDPQSCTTVGQKVTWGGTTYTCRSQDIMTEAQTKAFQETIANTKAYLEQILRVKPLPDRLIYYSTGFSNAMQNLTVIAKDCDLYIVWLVHPFQSSSNLFTVSDIYYNDTIYYAYSQMVVIFNPVNIPTNASQVNTQNDMFFNNVLKAIMTGIMTRGHFHNKLSSDYYPTPYCQLKKNNVEFTILTTPYAHHHGKHFFGQEWFIGDDNVCPSGIIMDPSSYQRPSTAIYAQDISCPFSLQHDGVPFMRFTEVSMAILLDSGNFEVDWRYGKPLIYGNKEYINGEYNLNWPLGPPYSTLPSYYYSRPNVTLDGASFEFKTWGTPSYYSGNCSQSVIASNFPDYCAAQSYYNPYNYQTFGVEDLGYLLLKGQDNYCPDGTATIPGLTYYTNDDCAVYHCAEDYQSFTLQVLLNQDTFEYDTLNCTHDRQTYTYNKWYKGNFYIPRTLVCPPPEAFCRTLEGYDKLYPSNPFQDVIFPTPTPFVTPRITPKNTPVMTPALTPKITPVNTPHYTPKITPVNTPRYTQKTTPLNTPFRTEYQTPHSTPHVTVFDTPRLTAKQTPFNSPHLTPRLTPFYTPKLTPHSTPHTTPAITPNETPLSTPIPTYVESAGKKVYRKHNVGAYMGFAYFAQY